jgi:hypothetical protein
MRRIAMAAPMALICLLAGAGCNGGTGSSAPPSVTTDVSPSASPGDEPPASAPPASPNAKPSPAAAASWPSPEDCVSYNPSTVTATFDNGLYTIASGSTVVIKLHGSSGDGTGDKGVALAKRYKKHCYIGRRNTRAEKDSYIFDYWRTLSGIKTDIPGQEDDCSDYDRTNLTVEDMGNGDGWRVKDHDHVLHLFDNGTDARNGKLVLAKYHKICFIGVTGDENQDQVSYSL